MRSCYTYHFIRQSHQESSKEPVNVGPGIGKAQKSLFHTIWRICPSPLNDSFVPMLFFNMPVLVQRLWITCLGNKNLVLGRTGDRSLPTCWYFMLERKFFTRWREWAHFWLVAPNPPPPPPPPPLCGKVYLFSSPSLLDIHLCSQICNTSPPLFGTHHWKTPDSMIHQNQGDSLPVKPVCHHDIYPGHIQYILNTECVLDRYNSNN